MSRVVVVGGGFGGMATAARLAKLGHEVTLVEAAPRLGGALGTVEQDGFAWDAGPTGTLLPAVVRDLFRKSGRPAEKEIELVPVEPAQQHRFLPGRKDDTDDDTVLNLPGGSRAAQIEAVGAALGASAAEAWASWVDGYAEVWELLRRDWFERPWDPEHANPDAVRLLRDRSTLHKSVQRAFRDARLRDLALSRVLVEGHDPRNVPAWAGVWSYVERNFGAWTVPGGMGTLTEVLTARLATRGVAVVTGSTVRDIAVEGGRAVGVSTDAGTIDADVVVSAIDPRRLPALAGFVERTMPAIPPVVCHIGLVEGGDDLPALPHEVVLHGDPMIVVRTNGTAPDGARAWTLLGRGKLAEDIVVAVHRRGLRIRDHVEIRVDRSPRDLVQEWGGSPLGVLWQGRATIAHRLGNRTPIDGVFQAGAHTAPGAGLPSVGLSAANVAQLVGPA